CLRAPGCFSHPPRRWGGVGRRTPPPATAHPAGIDSVRWLLADDFTVPLHAGLWQCLTALARRQEPVDPVTVLWEAQQRGLLDNGSEPGVVLRMLAEPAGSIEHWSEHVLERSLLAVAEHTGQRIEAYAGDPANTPFQLVIGARRALVDIAAVRTRWQHATGATPPQRRRPAPTTRAGPPTTRAAHAARATGATR
ncbi:DnaB-like helicase N-terminal domain-containing protein, partial [Streptomyces sp. NPDC058961]|uniref:DnaB-like helicase N-terminal domain-containing protein n=1 Tax=Streptomyces sp. NPDC058961 TaxID=3346680 RepID=UPI00369B730C